LKIVSIEDNVIPFLYDGNVDCENYNDTNEFEKFDHVCLFDDANVELAT